MKTRDYLEWLHVVEREVKIVAYMLDDGLFVTFSACSGEYVSFFKLLTGVLSCCKSLKWLLSSVFHFLAWSSIYSFCAHCFFPVSIQNSFHGPSCRRALSCPNRGRTFSTHYFTLSKYVASCCKGRKIAGLSLSPKTLSAIAHQGKTTWIHWLYFGRQLWFWTIKMSFVNQETPRSPCVWA